MSAKRQEASRQEARRWYVTGIVQGVGFRYFVRNHAQALSLTGYARNLSDGRVEVYAAGPPASLNELASAIHKGAPLSTVRSVEELEAADEHYSDFHVS